MDEADRERVVKFLKAVGEAVRAIGKAVAEALEPLVEALRQLGRAAIRIERARARALARAGQRRLGDARRGARGEPRFVRATVQRR
jgi:hypothetical protein